MGNSNRKTEIRFSEAGAVLLFPDNVQLLKRLHAATYRKDGSPFVCGCGLAHIHSKVEPAVLKMGPARGTIDLYLRGYYRNSGKYFGESIELPIEISEAAKPTELLKSTTAPADGAGR